MNLPIRGDEARPVTDDRHRALIVRPAVSCWPQVAAIIMLAIVVPSLMAFGGGAMTRVLYPVYAVLIGLMLFRIRKSAYPVYCIALFAITPFIRRVVDDTAGFADFNPVLLAPYVSLLPCLLSLARESIGGRPQALPFFLLIVSISYGILLALMQMRFVEGFYEPLRWILPVALAAFVIENRTVVDEIRFTLTGTLVFIIPLISAYGVAQYLNPMPWDVAWLENVIETRAATSFGRPEPYLIRVFSTLNSPGSFAVFLAMAMSLLIGEGGLPSLATLTGLPALALSVVRTGWIACGVGLLVVFLFASKLKKVKILGATLIVVIMAMGFAASVPPEAIDMLNQRSGSFADGSKDESAQDRLENYAAFFDRLAESPFGEGFGSVAGKDRSSTLDSGILEAFMIFGPQFGAIYFVAIGIFVIRSYRALRILHGFPAGYFGAVCGFVIITPLGSQIGEIGIIPWTAMSVLLASAEVATSPFQPPQSA